MTRLLLLPLLALAFNVAYATDYCSPTLCSGGSKHIACGNTGQFASTCPTDSFMVAITSYTKRLFLEAHNEKRNFIAGGGDPKHSKACRMATMQWDDELSSLAALNVKQCTMAHDQCRNTDAFKYAGQNIAYIGYYDPIDVPGKIKQTVDMWYGEVVHSNMTFINAYPANYNGPVIGHFTGMMLDKNIRVGCAMSFYPAVGQSYKIFLATCNYATTNAVNFPIYAACPTAASKCTTGVNATYPNLCTVNEVYDVNKWF